MCICQRFLEHSSAGDTKKEWDEFLLKRTSPVEDQQKTYFANARANECLSIPGLSF